MENSSQARINKTRANWGYRKVGVSNLLRMGHCAPTAMQTILEVSSAEKEWLVRLSAGMPGGIGNMGNECGGFTSPLALLGIRYGLSQDDHGLPVVFNKGHALCHNFLACHKTLQCRDIRGNDHFPRHCIRPVLMSPEIYMDALNGNQGEPISPEKRRCYARLYAHLSENDFHCARSVLIHLGYASTKFQELFNACSGFIGGTIFMGKTCSALAAGVMAIGLKAGDIENNPLRVMRLLAIMTIGGNAFDERINKFNRSMNRGFRLSRWFTKEFGSTQCRTITQCDFSTETGVSNFIEGKCIDKCKLITEKVAQRVQGMLQSR